MATTCCTALGARLARFPFIETRSAVFTLRAGIHNSSDGSAGSLMRGFKKVTLRTPPVSSRQAGRSVVSFQQPTVLAGGTGQSHRSSNINYHEHRPYTTKVVNRTSRSFITSLKLSTSDQMPATPIMRMEEETLHSYKADDYLPVQLGQLLHDRYLVVAKLGFGTSSTVWLVQDHNTSKYYALKACTHGVISKEIEVSDLIHATEAESPDTHPGIARLRTVVDKFMVEGATAQQHQCLIFEPCGMSFMQFMNMMPDKVIDKDMLQHTMLCVLLAVDVLHQIGVVHTDLSPNNVLMGAEDQSIFAKMKQSEAEEPSLRKVDGNRTIYRSRQMPITKDLPKITDFGAAFVGEPGQKHTGDVMPNFYRAPEVILGMPWDSKIDMWSIGTMVRLAQAYSCDAC